MSAMHCYGVTLKVTLFFVVPSAAVMVPLALTLPGDPVVSVKVAEDEPPGNWYPNKMQF